MTNLTTHSEQGKQGGFTTLSRWLEKPLFVSMPGLTIEFALFGFLLLLAALSRFYILGERVMSHDESLHTQYSWYLFKGQGYQHNPMMHGPLQFHLLALSYFLFGVSDFTARIPSVLFSIATIGAIWHWRRYLGKTGALVAGFLALISPYLLYYGRYVRNESYVGLLGIIMLLATLRYLETGQSRYVYWFVASIALHFTVKETSFIYAAQMLLFLAVFFISRITRADWKTPEYFRPFIVALLLTLLFVAGAFLFGQHNPQSALSAIETAAPADPLNPAAITADDSPLTSTLLLGGLSLLSLLAAAYFLIRGYSVQSLRENRAFSLLIVLGTMVLPQLTAFAVKLAGGNPLDYSAQGMLFTAYFLVPILLISIAIGLWWRWEVWAKSALIFWGIFIIFYTTMFTNGPGFFTGLIGSLGYWIEQQAVERGSQPQYFYWLIQIPIYEFLPALGSFLAAALSFKRAKSAPSESEKTLHVLLGWWIVSSVLAFTIAGEKMPWLTYHMTLPMVLWAGWALGQVIDSIKWSIFRAPNGLVVAATSAVALLSGFGVIRAIAFHSPPPFQGKDLTQLEATSTFLLAFLTLAVSGAFLTFYLKKLSNFASLIFFKLLLLAFFGLLTVQTVRATIMANYKNYDNAKEYLVYAHSFTGVKDIMRQVDAISERVAGGKTLVVAYDDDVTWPVTWYLRDYTNQKYYGNSPSRDLRDAPVIIVGNDNFSKIEPIVAQGYYRFDYIRMVWPNQDYFNLVNQRSDPDAPFAEDYACRGALGILKLAKQYDYSRVCQAILDPGIRKGIFYIWLNRDFSHYATAVNSQSTTLENWSPADSMRLYVRKDIASQIWNYGLSPAISEPIVDPYENGYIELRADKIVGSGGDALGQFNMPRGLAFAQDGSFYVADSFNNRIQHISADGVALNTWGTFADAAAGEAPLGTFKEPWGIAIGPDGSIYVTDTWNHRVQKFTPEGKSLTTWGTFGFSAENPLNFYGPRGIAVNAAGHVFVADTGNKRIAVFDENGKFLSEFGSPGFGVGQFDENVDVAVGANGQVYVTDTWNQRVQVFAPLEDGLTYVPSSQWDITGWYSGSAENKPFLAISPLNGNVFVTDPEGYRVLEFTAEGVFVRYWGNYSNGADGFALVTGVRIDAQGHVWVTDPGNNRVMRFTLP